MFLTKGARPLRNPLVVGSTKSVWSGRWDLNPRQLAWEARTLPLSYARSLRYAVLASVYTAIPTYCPVAVLSYVYDSLRDRMKHESNWHLNVPRLLHTVSKRQISPPLDSLIIKVRSYSLTKHDGRLTDLSDVS